VAAAAAAADPASNPQSSNTAIIRELQKLFARMTTSEFSAADPSGLVAALEVDPRVQQDPHEFARLFLSLIQENPNLNRVVRRLFEGDLVYKSKCCSCNTEREKKAKYSDLSLPVNVDTFEASLRNTISPEMLNGSNQVWCEACGKCADTTRTMMLNTLPPFINVHLMRFQFDKKAMCKKKNRNKFSFPRVIDWKPFVHNPQSDGNYNYELMAVLVHQGASASGGHYVCYAQSEVGGRGPRWFEYNDTVATDVTDLVSALFDDKGARIVAHSSNRLQALWSHDVYTLIYRLIGVKTEVPVVPEPLASAIIDPSDVQPLNFLHKVKSLCDVERKLVYDRRTLVTKVVLNPAVVAEIPKENMRFISTEWLKTFLTVDECGPINNKPLLCEHGQLSPNVRDFGKCITAEAWEMLHSRFGGDPPLSLYEVCPRCIKEYCRQRIAGIDADAKQRAVMDYIKKTSTGKNSVPPEAGYWISKDWLKCWADENEVGSYSEMTDLITCPHGNLTTDEKRRKLIDVSAWSYISSLAGKPVKEFVGTTEPCPECLKELNAQKVAEEKVREKRKSEKEEFAKVLVESHPLDYTSYYLLDRAWYDSWKKWLNSSSIGEELPPFDNSSLLCPHKKIAYDPSDYIKKKPTMACNFVPVPEKMWKALASIHGVPKLSPIKFKLEEKKEPKFSCEVCWDCIIERQESASLERQNFTSGKLTICRLPGRYANSAEVLSSVLNPPKEEPENNRKGTRSRPATSAGPKRVSKAVEGVDSSWSVQGLKMHLLGNYEGSLDCGMPDEQVLIFEGQILDDEKALFDYHIEKDKSVIYLGVLKEPEPSIPVAAAASASASETAKKPPKKEEGFAGSRLLSSSGSYATCSSSCENPSRP